MKKKYVISIIILAIIIISIAGIMIYKQMQKKGREYEIEKINIENYEYFILRQAEQYGVINKKGETIIDCQYKNIIIPNPQKPIFICYSDKTKVLNQNQEAILTEYENIEPIKLKNIASNIMYEKNILTFEKDGKVGLINLEGKVIAKPIYESIDALPYKEGELLVKLDGKLGVINNKGNYLVKPEYDQITVDNYTTEEAGYKNAGYIVSNTTEDGYRYGYVDVEGNIILPPEYTEISRIIDVPDKNNIYLIAAQNGQYGVFKNNEQIVNNEYQSISYQSDNQLLILEKTKKFGVATIEGNIIIPVEFTQIDSTGMYIYATIGEEVQVYKKDGTKADVDSNVYIIETSDENYKIKIDNSEGSVYRILDKEGKQLTTADYSYIEYLYDDYFIVSVTGGKLGIINIKEEPKVEIKYDSIEKLENTEMILTTLSENNTTQLYDKQLNKICEMENAIIVQKDNYIKCYNFSETKYFDLDGKEKKNIDVLPDSPIYAKVQNGKWGFVDKTGKVIVDYIYDKATELNEYGYAGIKLGEKWGVVNEKGEVIIEPTYTFYTQTEPSFIKDYYKVEYGFGEFYYTK